MEAITQMNKAKMIAIIFSFILSICTGAQELDQSTGKERNWRFSSAMQTQSLSFSLRDRKTESTTNSTDPNAVNYEPNVGQRIYFVIGYKDLSVFYAFSTSPEEDTIALKGKSKQNDFGFTYNSDFWLVESFYKDYKGFFVESDNQLPTIRPDLESKLIGFSFFHTLSSSYSLKPLYSLKWSGEKISWGYIAGINLNHFNFTAESPVLSRNGFVSLKQNYLSASGGISGFYSQNRYLYGGSLLASLGPEYHSVDYQTSAIREDNGLGYAFGFHMDIAAAYKWTDFTLGGRLKSNILSTYVGDTGIQANGFDFDIFVTYYF